MHIDIVGAMQYWSAFTNLVAAVNFTEFFNPSDESMIKGDLPPNSRVILKDSLLQPA